jgi:hypothetical protein
MRRPAISNSLANQVLPDHAGEIVLFIVYGGKVMASSNQSDIGVVSVCVKKQQADEGSLLFGGPCGLLDRLTDFHQKVGQPGGEDRRADERQDGADCVIGGRLPEDGQADASDGQGNEDGDVFGQVGFHFKSPFLVGFLRSF